MSATSFSPKLKGLLDEVSKETDKALHNILSKEEEIREHCASLRNKVDAKTEIMIEEIRHWNEETRNKIDKYEKERLDKFNAKEFEASASRLKSLINDVSDYQAKIEQHIQQATSEEHRAKVLYQEACTMLRQLKRQSMLAKKQKFGDQILEFTLLSENKLDPGCLATLNSASLNIIEKLERVKALRKMSELLSHVFVKPTGNLEFIAVLLDMINLKFKVRFIKMDSTGTIVKVKNTDLSLRHSTGIRALKDYFILQNEELGFLRFDYEFNQMTMSSEFNYSGIRHGFAANQRSIFSIHFEQGKDWIRCSNHDLTDSHYLPTEFQDLFFPKLLATDKYLYVWYSDRVRIIDIRYRKSLCTPRVVDDKPFEIEYSFDVKMMPDGHIAIYYQHTSILRFYTADAKLDLVKELKINIDNDTRTFYLSMSTDCSGELCFYNCQNGDIYHYIC